jgi:hypothetical protein
MGTAYVVGGTVDQLCERFDPKTNTWQQVPSFKNLVAPGDGLFSFAMCIVK